MLDDSWVHFIETHTSGVVAQAKLVASGASRRTWLVDVEKGGRTLELVLRCDGGDGPFRGSELDLAREAVVYRALQGRGVRIPKLYAGNASALLLERVPGTDAFDAVLDPTRRAAIERDFFVALAELHLVNADRLALPGFAVPADGPDHARCDLDRWRRLAAERVGPDPLCDFAARWLDTSAPAADGTVLCHGDAGPGNFLFEGERVTALLDWEFAHLGDPLDDLAWVAMRAHLHGGFGDLSEGFRAWREASGMRFDVARVEYYRALVLLRMAIACRIALAHAEARGADTTAYGLMLPYLRWLLPDALARAGCKSPELAQLAEQGSDALERTRALASRARPLEPLPAA
ncbi:MAG TPA: phosphotransferase family protein [Myxococcota bacterium]|nr:phosphotransferase family protein [Myxococcota bacterium]